MASSLTVGEQIADILDEYEKEVQETARKVIKKVAQETAKKVAEAAREQGIYNENTKSRKGHYVDGFRVKTIPDRDIPSYFVHNAKKPQLTHLLENGHLTRNGGRTKARPHFIRGQEWADSVIVRRIEEKL